MMLAGERCDATDFDLPDPVPAYGDGINTITATGAFAPLPQTPVTAEIINPHPTRNLLVLVTFGAWMVALNGGSVRAGLRVSGNITISPGVSGGLAPGWGQILFTASPYLDHDQAVATLILPPTVPGAANRTVFFAAEAYRDGTGTQEVRYPTIEIVPQRYL